jgi:ABC-type uncharacterized transport system substrate-binding protein
MRYLPERGPRELMVLQPGIPSIRILKGKLPRDLPIQAPRRYALVINLTTAKDINLKVPPD